MAIELANLRQPFSPISSSSFVNGLGSATARTGVVPGIDAGANGDTLLDRRSPLPLDNAFVQQTKDQIRTIVESIAELAQAPIAPDDFIEAVLPKVAQAMGADAAALWQQLPDSNWRLIGNFKLPQPLIDAGWILEADPHARGENQGQPERYGQDGIYGQDGQDGIEKLDSLEKQLASALERDPAQANGNRDTTEDLREFPGPSVSHGLILDAVARERQPILIPPNEACLSRERPANPISKLLIFAPLPLAKELGHYWLQVVQSPSGGPASHRGYLRFVSQLADLMGDYFRSHRLRVLERDREYLAIAETTLHELSLGWNPKLGIAKLLRTIREHAHGEHAFLLVKESVFGRWRVVGAAGLVEIDRGATGIGQIERAASVLQGMVRDGGTLNRTQLPAGDQAKDPDLTQFLETFSVSELQWIKPLRRDASQRELDRQPASKIEAEVRSSKQDVALLLTWSGTSKPPERSAPQSALIVRLGLSTLQIGWWKRALMAHRQSNRSMLSIANPVLWPRIAKWTAAILVLGLISAVPVPIHLNATGILVPQVQQHVYAPVDATVAEVLVEHGQKVKQGDLLLRLKSIPLTLDSDRATSELQSKRERLEVLKSRLLTETALPPLQQDQLAMEGKEIESSLSLDEKKIQVLQRQLDSLNIRASVDGVVSTWNLQDSLRDRPLKTGQWLLSIHQSESAWIMEASLPERDAQEFRSQLENQQAPSVATMTSMPQIQLPVRISQTAAVRIEHSQPGHSINDPHSASLRLRFDVDTRALPAEAALAGATARIRIPVGRGPLLWALGKDFANQVWSRVQLWI